MSIAQLKKQAKNLVRLLPDHIKANPTGGSLAACQELIAKASGFPSFHAASEEKSEENKSSKPLSYLIFDDLRGMSRKITLGGENAWLNRTQSLVSTVLNLQIFLEARGESLPPNSPYDLHALEAMNEQWRTGDQLFSKPLTRYLELLPAYEFPSARGSKPLQEISINQHGIVIREVKSVLAKQPKKQ